MTATNLPLPAAVARVGAARGVPADADWAQDVAAALVMGDIRDELIVRVLDEIADQIREADEDPRELFGDPYVWANERRREWRTDGVDTTENEPLTARTFVLETLGGAAAFALLFMLSGFVTWDWGRDLTLAWLLAPLAMALVARATIAVYAAVRDRRSQAMGVVAAVPVLLAGATGIAGLFAFGNDVRLASSATVWMLVVAVGYGTLAWALGRIWPKPPLATRADPPSDDESWLAELGSALRHRGDLSDSRVATIVAEAREHASEAGSSLADEFGSPRGYAGRFTQDRASRATRTAWLATALAAGPILVLAIRAAQGEFWESGSAIFFAWFACLAVAAVVEWRKVQRFRTRAA